MTTDKQLLEEALAYIEGLNPRFPSALQLAQRIRNHRADNINLDVVFDYPFQEGDFVNRGIVVLNGVNFANVYTLTKSGGFTNHIGRICLNRSSEKAFAILPNKFPWFKNHQDMLEWIYNKIVAYKAKQENEEAAAAEGHDQ